MKFILFDEESGQVLGFDVETQNQIVNPTDNYIWYTTSDEVYNTILRNAELRINLKDTSLQQRIIDFNNNREEYKAVTDVTALPIVVEMENLIDRHKLITIEEVKASKCRKNNNACQQYIEFGVTTELNGERVRFSYSEVDQLNWNELHQMIKDKLITNEVPIKPNGYSNYIYVNIDTFESIYKQLVRNKYYQLFYLRVFNDYIYSLDDINTIRRLQYETVLPQEVQEELEQRLKNLNL